MRDTDRKTMNLYLKENIEPSLRLLNFKGSFPHYRRIINNKVNLLTFQFDLHGGGFVIEIANCYITEDTMLWDKRIPANKLTAHDLYTRKRIQPNMTTDNSSTDDWFRYDVKYLWGFGNIYLKICKEVLSKLDLMKNYWDSGYINNPKEHTDR